MALSNDEALRADTCELLSRLAQPCFPIGYARIHSWHINPSDPSFEALLSLYYNEAARKENGENCAYYSIGGHITPETLAALQGADDRAVFYKAIEYFIHFQAYHQRLQTLADDDGYIAALMEKQDILDRLDAEAGLGLSTLFTLSGR